MNIHSCKKNNILTRRSVSFSLGLSLVFVRQITLAEGQRIMYDEEGKEESTEKRKALYEVCTKEKK